jgi:O-acetyl-ADP-ribose deacetylase (regulator of RNase III)
MSSPRFDGTESGMAEKPIITEVRFGRTLVEVVTGELVDQHVQALVYPANSRGVMGAGPAGSLRTSAGADVEREAMTHAPLDLGSAIATGAGRLAEHGVELILHASIVPSIGERAAPQAVFRALDDAMRLAIDHKIRSIAIPFLGVSADDTTVERHALAEGLVDVVIKRLRQRGVRLERVIFAVRFDDDRAMLAAVIQRARERGWTTPA